MKFDQTKVLEKINSKCAPFMCPMCKKTASFEFAPVEFQYLGFERNGVNLKLEGGINMTPVVLGTCPNCGFIASFNLEHVLK